MFENAKFGDIFVTKDNRMAVFVNQDDIHHYQCILSDGAVEDNYLLDGTLDYIYSEEDYSKEDWEELNNRTIVSKYHEPIDETTLYERAYKWTNFVKETDLRIRVLAQECAMVGYRKAKAGE